MSTRIDYYFDEPGPLNTDRVIEAVSLRINETGIRKVIVASTSGRTALKFAKALKGKASIIAVSYRDMEPSIVGELKSLGVEVVERCHLPLHVKGVDLARNAYYTLGQGFKVAVEVTLIAVDKGLVKVGEQVISVGGTDVGADTAVIVKASSSSEMFTGPIDRRLEVVELIAMPRHKKFWE
ncbi:MAG: pyruvate kinase alpha/beta domain-containing protein [Candidatus Nezhaarchaeales archaeon]